MLSRAYSFIFFTCGILFCLRSYGQPCSADFNFTVSGFTATFHSISTGSPTNYLWSFGDGSINQGGNTTVTHTYQTRKEYFVRLKVSDPNNPLCLDSITKRVCVGCVFPGDANNDGTVNNKDLLYVGLAYGAIGPIRIDTSNLPHPAPSTPWVSSIGIANHPGGINYNHSDCDGNGIINRHDVRIIEKNYGAMSTPKGSGNGCLNLNDIPLYFEIIDSIPVGSAVNVAIKLGDLQIPAQDIYGIAYSVQYSGELIQPGTIGIDYNGSLLGPQQDIIYLSVDSPSAQKIESAISRIDHSNLTIAGNIGTLNFVMEDNLAQKTFITKTLSLSFTDVFLIQNDGTEIPVCAQQDSAVVYQKLLTSDGGLITKKELKVYPNPTDGQLTIELPKQKAYTLSLANVLGKRVFVRNAETEEKIKLDVTNFPKGIYFLSISDNSEVNTLKIEIAR